jgi:hypothetical protein
MKNIKLLEEFSAERTPQEVVDGLNRMAKGDLERISDYANMILDRVNKGQQLSPWMYSKLTSAVNDLNSVHDSLDGTDGVIE